MHLLFDFNLLLRNGINWSPDNAEEILDYAIHKGYAQNMHFELGNEPNQFPESVHRSLSGSQIGRDFQILQKIIRDRIPKCPHLKEAFIVGPDITRPNKNSLNFLNDYIKPAAGVIDYLTFHTYYLNLETAKPEDFTNYKLMDTLAQQVDEVRSSIYTAHKIRKDIWLGESGTCLGGTKGVEFCQCYLAGFLWLDKLGLAASMDVKVVIRQVLYDGVDGLLDKHMNIMPDYWLSVLFKKLAGNRVLEVARATLQNQVRFYAHCTNTKLSTYPSGTVTYFGLNMLTSEVNLTLTEEHMTLTKHLYWLTPGDDQGLISKHIALNNHVLKMVNSTQLPQMPPSVIGANEAVILPQMSFGFVVIPDAKAEACV
ncbi:hypothetical protein CAPTEDRAFT_160540 [Capitella teleta]|uniref:Heparanase n=1 Tax=Capitella teleta TaxID=283909 RepID=R7TS39_CAPTE|nr:hypothetical protein CAPTEDRAFT_160540 [Capitella teleta]|eukprot:ELT94291.1 hypothetical protein CAPTEDRAFT_160540 [Capitella teleta]